MLYHTKKNASLLYTIPSEHYLNQKDYKAGDAVVHSTGKCLEFKTRKKLATNLAYVIRNQFEHVNMSENNLVLSVLYNEMFGDFSKNTYLQILVDPEFQIDNIHLFSQSECALIFPTVESIDSELEPYNIRWSMHMQKHNRCVELYKTRSKRTQR